MSKIDLIFPTAIYKSFNILDEQYRKSLIEKSYSIKRSTPNQSHKWDCQIYTNYGNQLSIYKEFDHLIDIVLSNINTFAHEMGSRGEYHLTSAWLNIAKEGDFQEHHRHNSSTFSAVYYLQAPSGSGDIAFESPIGFMNDLKEQEIETIYNKERISYPPIENSLIIFRSYLQHMVKVGKNKEDRISIALNFS